MTKKWRIESKEEEEEEEEEEEDQRLCFYEFILVTKVHNKVNVVSFHRLSEMCPQNPKALELNFGLSKSCCS
jgi:hypothetical protein